MNDTNRRYPNLRLSGTPDRLGRMQKQIRRAFIASGGKPLTWDQRPPGMVLSESKQVQGVAQDERS